MCYIQYVEHDELMKIVEDTSKPVKWEAPELLRIGNGIKRTRQVAFLKEFAKCGTINKSCSIVGINIATERSWRTNDHWYQEHFKDAVLAFRDKISDEVARRAIDGETVPIVGRVMTPLGPEDQIIGHKTVRSDLLLMFLAKRHDPAYKDNYKPPEEEEKRTETVSPLTRITIRLDMMEGRKTEPRIIDVTPQPQLEEQTDAEDS